MLSCPSITDYYLAITDTPMNPPQSWTSCDADIRVFVLGFIDLLHASLGNNLIGVYLHGSLAMGSYYRPKSDIDTIVVVAEKLHANTIRSLVMAIARMAEQRPTTGNLETSILTAPVAKHFPIPVPFELHYSTGWHDELVKGEIGYKGKKTITNLPSHLTYINKRGVCLYGKPIPEVFGECAWPQFMDAILTDFNNIVYSENILRIPYYGALNICRVLQLLSENTRVVHSKDEGGEWGLMHVPPEHRAIMLKALAVYHAPRRVTEAERPTGGVVWNSEELLALRDYAKSCLMLWS